MSGELWGLLQEHRRRIKPATLSNRQVAEAMGIAPTTVGNWRKGLSRLPERASMLALSDLIRTPYERVLEAALRDANYLPETAARATEAKVGARRLTKKLSTRQMLAEATKARRAGNEDIAQEWERLAAGPAPEGPGEGQKRA